jgi:hypothetical protein
MEEVSITTGLWLKWNFQVQGVDGRLDNQVHITLPQAYAQRQF